MTGRDFPVGGVLAILGAALWLTTSNRAHGAEQRIRCPPSLEVAETKESPAGWRLVKLEEARVDGRTAALTKAGMLHGLPEESGYLAPAENKGGKRGNHSSRVQRWNFDQPHWYQTFVYCGYGDASAPLRLFQPIAEDATTCTLTSSITNGAVDRMEFVCK